MAALLNWNTSDVILVTHRLVSDQPFDENSSMSSSMLYNSSNSSSTSSLAAADNFWLDNRCKSFEFFFNTVLIGLLCLFGIATNILAIVVLGKDRHNRVATFLLRSLSVADIAVLVVTFVVMSVFFGTSTIPGVVEGYTGFLIPYLKKYVNPVGYMTQSATIWITVLVAVNRYIAIVHPFKAHRFLTIKVARLQVAVVFILSALVNVPRFFQVEFVEVVVNNVTRHQLRVTDMGSSQAYEVAYLNVFYTAVILILPLILLIVLNAIIVTELQMSKRRMKGNLQGSTAQYIGNHEKNITIVIIVVVMVVVICHTPDRILTVFKAINKTNANSCPHPLIYAGHACNLLVVLNSSTNFIVYCAFRRRFRRILLTRVCRPCRGGADRFDESTSYNSSVHYRQSYTVCDSNSFSHRTSMDDSRRQSKSYTGCDSQQQQRQRRLRVEQQFSIGSFSDPLLMKIPEVTTPSTVSAHDDTNGRLDGHRSIVPGYSSTDGLPTTTTPYAPMNFFDSETCFIPALLELDGGVENRILSSRSTSLCDAVVVVEAGDELSTCRKSTSTCTPLCATTKDSDNSSDVAIGNGHSINSIVLS